MRKKEFICFTAVNWSQKKKKSNVANENKISVRHGKQIAKWEQ